MPFFKKKFLTGKGSDEHYESVHEFGWLSCLLKEKEGINGDKRYDEGEVLIANRLNDDKIDSILFLNSMPAIIIIINLNSSFVIACWRYANKKKVKKGEETCYLLTPSSNARSTHCK